MRAAQLICLHSQDIWFDQQTRQECRDWTSLLKSIIPIINQMNVFSSFVTLSGWVPPHKNKDRQEDEANAIETLALSSRWLCSLHCSGWPIWEPQRLLLFWGPYQCHGGRSTPSTQMNLQHPWGATGGGHCAITKTTWEETGEGWRQGYLGSVFISLMSHSLQSDRQANWKLLSHKILHGSILPSAPPPPHSKNLKNNLRHRGDFRISSGLIIAFLQSPVIQACNARQEGNQKLEPGKQIGKCRINSDQRKKMLFLWGTQICPQ